MKALVVGCGSIGRRHCRNLNGLGVELHGVDPVAKNLEAARVESGVRPVATLEEGLALKPDFAVVATPSSRHLVPALAAVRAGCHIFIEKPLSHSLDGIDELIRVSADKKLQGLVGCNLRFHPGVSALKRELDSGAAGEFWTAQISSGQFLPDWHPGEDYREGYSARQELGGGVILDGIHEIDYALWLFGAPRSVTCRAGRVSNLEIDVEDSADLLLEALSGAAINIHMDYLQRGRLRRATVSGSEGTLELDIAANTLKAYSAKSGSWRDVALPPFDANAMYVAEMRHFIACIEGRERPAQDLSAGKLALEVALAAKRSSAEGRRVDF